MVSVLPVYRFASLYRKRLVPSVSVMERGSRWQQMAAGGPWEDSSKRLRKRLRLLVSEWSKLFCDRFELVARPLLALASLLLSLFPPPHRPRPRPRPRPCPSFFVHVLLVFSSGSASV